MFRALPKSQHDRLYNGFSSSPVTSANWWPLFFIKQRSETVSLSLTPSEVEMLRQWRCRIGRNIQRQRMQQRMRLETCALKAGISMSQLDRYECGGGEIPPYLLVRLAHLFAVPLEVLTT
jgi:hypothetical protein